MSDQFQNCELPKEKCSKDLQSSRNAFQYFEYGITIVGWLPPTGANQLYLVLRTLMAWSMFWVPFGMFASYFKDIANYTPGQLLNSLQVSVNAMGSIGKVVILLLYLRRLQQVKELLSRLDEYCLDRAARLQVHHCVRRCNLIYLVYQILYSGYIVCTYVTSVLNGVAPWRIYNPLIDWRQSTSHLWLAATLEFFFTHFACMQNLLTDVYPLLCGTMMRVHIKVLEQRVQKLRTDLSESEGESYEKLVKCIANHQLIREYADLIRPIISGTIFIQFLLIGICLGCALVNLMIFADFWSGFVTAVYIVALIVQTFPFCYTCNLIQDDSQELVVAIFHSNWDGASRGYKSALMCFLHCAQQPIEYTAGSTLPISIKTNITVAKLAFSVVTFVKQLNLAEKLRKK